MRLRNQAAYSAWHELLTPGLVLGKDQNIYQQGPADAYLGRDFIGEAEIARRARRLRLVQDSLQAHGTQLLFLIAPGKTRLQPQYLADSSATQPKGPTNYDVVRAQFAKQGVHTLDAAALLLRWRDAGAAYPLFPRTGTHWSGYAVAHVAYTLFRRLESRTGHDLPDFARPRGRLPPAARLLRLRPRIRRFSPRAKFGTSPRFPALIFWQTAPCPGPPPSRGGFHSRGCWRPPSR